MVSPNAYYQQAQKLQKNNHLPEALQLLEKAVPLLKEGESSTLAFNIHYHIGLFCTELDQVERAIKAFQMAIRVCPEDRHLWLPYYGWGFVLSANDRLLEAIEPFSNALRYCEEVMPRYLAHLELADAFFDKGEIDRVILHQKTAFELAKENHLEEEMLSTARELGDTYLEFDQEEKGGGIAGVLLGLCQRAGALFDWERLFIGNLSNGLLGYWSAGVGKRIV